MSNEAAERLPYGAFPCSMCGTPVRVVSGGEGTLHYEPVLDAAPAAERRATVERIRAAFDKRLAEGSFSDVWQTGQVAGLVDAILDAEAQR